MFKNKPAIKLALDKLSPYYVLHRAMLGAVSRNNAIAGGLDHCPQGMAGDFPRLCGYLSRSFYPDWAFLLTHWPFVRPMKKPIRLGFQVAAAIMCKQRKVTLSQPKPNAYGLAFATHSATERPVFHRHKDSLLLINYLQVFLYFFIVR